jgi:hypothetical protein
MAIALFYFLICTAKAQRAQSKAEAFFTSKMIFLCVLGVFAVNKWY